MISKTPLTESQLHLVRFALQTIHRELGVTYKAIRSEEQYCQISDARIMLASLLSAEVDLPNSEISEIVGKPTRYTSRAKLSLAAKCLKDADLESAYLNLKTLVRNEVERIRP